MWQMPCFIKPTLGYTTQESHMQYVYHLTRANGAFQPMNLPFVNATIEWKQIVGLLCFILSFHKGKSVNYSHAHTRKIPFPIVKNHHYNTRQKCSKILWFTSFVSFRFVFYHFAHTKVFNIIDANNLLLEVNFLGFSNLPHQKILLIC